MRNLLVGVIVGIIGFYGYHKFRENAERQRVEAAAAGQPAHRAVNEAPTEVEYSSAPEPGYRCDGRQHCSQMTSCEEATWMLRNCTGMKMDGDGDGAPCERGPC